MAKNKPAVLIIYTGGTIGMLNDEDDALCPVNFQEIEQVLPEINRMGYTIRTITFESPVDSSDMNPAKWVQLASIIESSYDLFDGFVVLHGTDTMSYTASAISYMCSNLQKPVVFTGSQLPLGTLRSDGREHLLTSIEIAALQQNGRALIPEVCIYFNNKLFRGNRATKVSSELFNAFRSGNFPPLAEVGVHININANLLLRPDYSKPAVFIKDIDTAVGLLKMHPGINESVVAGILNNHLIKAVVIESYGSGTFPSEERLILEIRKAVSRGIVLMNVSQCIIGGVNMKKYKTSLCLQESGVICGRDLTTEAAVTKLMFLMGQQLSDVELKEKLNQSLRGEVSIF